MMKADGRRLREAAELEASGPSPVTVAENIGFESGKVHFDNGRPDTFVPAEVGLNSGQSGGQCEAMASSCGDSKGRVLQTAHPLRLQCSDCEELLHELSNILAGVLINVQLLEWKLPPYSYLKRPVRAVERNAQRGSELLKRLMRRFADGELEKTGADLTRERAKTVSACAPEESAAAQINDEPMATQAGEGDNPEPTAAAGVRPHKRL